MKKHVSLLIGTILLMLGSTAIASISDRYLTNSDRPCVNTHEVLSNFLLAVDRGELILFGEILNRDEITPLRVELFLDLSNGSTTTKVYSDLKKPIILPDDPKFMVNSISAILSGDNHIAESEAHVMPK